jgi:hypothetical protein
MEAQDSGTLTDKGIKDISVNLTNSRFPLSL